MKVLKFGGSSVANADNIRKVMAIISESLKEESDLVVVVSALGGVTDALIKMATLASQKNEEYKELAQKISLLHREAVQSLVKKDQDAVLSELEKKFNVLNECLDGIYLLQELSLRSLDKVMSYGELLSSFIISSALNSEDTPCQFVDARTVICTDDFFGSARVDIPKTYELLSNAFPEGSGLSLLGGFIATTKDGVTTTLGRGGSDYTAALVGAGVNASLVEIWTDVNGVMTADPRKVKDAFPLVQVSYEEAGELAHFGAKVIHPKTMKPAQVKNIPLQIKNTFNPDAPGTLISNTPNFTEYTIKGISTLDGVSLLRLQSNNGKSTGEMIAKVLDVLSRSHVSVLLVSQASYEQSISIAISSKESEKACSALEKAFHLEIAAEHMSPVHVEAGLSIVAIVGKQMKGVTGISGTFFKTLGENEVNVVAIAQGSSELNISAVIKSEDQVKALQAVHHTFFSHSQDQLSVFMIGTGLIGSTLLKQIDQSHAAVKIVGLANSQQMAFDLSGVSLKSREEELASGEASDLESFVQRMKDLQLRNPVFVDCTASEKVTEYYEKVLDLGIPIVTPNKKANSGSFELYQKLQKLSQENNAPFYYETNVGAGLPLIHTVKDLLASGDQIQKIEAVLSGTLSYIFNTYSESSEAFSAIVLDAQSKGYTEPDPRDDLNGMDVARKILILAREMGLEMEIDDVENSAFLAKECFEVNSVDEFYAELEKLDASFEEKKNSAKANGKVLRFIASLEHGKAKIGLQEVDSSHPFYSLSGSDNIIAISTQRYSQTPLVIKGPGAGAEVTAAGVFSDMLRLLPRQKNLFFPAEQRDSRSLDTRKHTEEHQTPSVLSS